MMVIVWSWYIKNFFVCCQSEILAKEISKLAHVKLALGSASTALAATLYKDFETTHSLFKFPVVEELDIIRPQFTNRM